MALIFRGFLLLFTGFAMMACSGPEMTGSWTSSDFEGPIKKVYIVGIGKSEMNRRVFEDAFSNKLFSMGVSTEASYRDIMTSQEVNKDILAQKMVEKGCDSVLLTRLIGQRKETVVTPGHVYGYSPGPFYGGYGGYARPGHYNSWGNYYAHPYNVVYEPATSTELVVLTLESVMYDLQTQQLIWSAQYETVVEGGLDKMVQDFVNAASKDLKKKKLI
jgi:hypothetical protein